MGNRMGLLWWRRNSDTVEQSNTAAAAGSSPSPAAELMPSAPASRRKRRLERACDDVPHSQEDARWRHLVVGLPLHIRSAAAEVDDKKVVVQSLVTGSSVEETYGAHFHCYASADPAESHGVALGWDLGREELSTLGMVRLCRVASTANKHVILLAPRRPQDDASSAEDQAAQLPAVFELAYQSTI